MPNSSKTRLKILYSICAFYYFTLIYFTCLGLLKPRRKQPYTYTMDSFCGSPFWQQNLTWNNTAQPDFTPCFQETVLTWLPCLVLWFFTPLDVINVYRSERRYIPVTLLNLFKTFLATVLCMLSVAELIETLTKNESEVALVDYVTPIIKSLTYLLVFGLFVFHRNRGVHTSGLMFVFWLLMSISVIINFRSLLRSTFYDHNTTTIADWHLSELEFTVKLIATPIVLIQLVLSCIADKRAEDTSILLGEDHRHRSPETEASIMSLMTFWWLNSMIYLGYKRALNQDDLYSVKTEDKTEVVSRKYDQLLLPTIQKALDERRNVSDVSHGFDSTYKPLINRDSGKRTSWIPLGTRERVTRLEIAEQERQRGKREINSDEEDAKYVNLTAIILKSFWPNILNASLLKLAGNLLTFASPLLLGRIITFVSSDEPAWRGGLYAGTLFLLSLIQSIITTREAYVTSINVMRVRTCTTSAVYRKTLRLSSQGKKNYTTGQIVNFMAVDTQRMADFIESLNNLWAAPIQLIISMILLYQQLGFAIFAGLGVMLINIPVNGWVAIKLRDFQKIVMQYKDRRIKLLSQIINGIKIIKIHAWEEPFRKRTEDIRKKEIQNLSKQAWYSSAITFAFVTLPFIVALASFALYTLIDPENILDANKIFVSLSLFNIMRIPLAILPMIITNLTNYLVAVKRLNKFLESDEIDQNYAKQIDDDKSVIRITDGSFKWDKKGEVVLENINFDVPRMKLIAVVGSVGSGKSTLLSAILGDLEKSNGDVLMDMGSSLSYVPQEAWILNTTLKSNILFNKMANEDKYRKVIEACALAPDLKTLELGDQSEIGEKGLNLSGGQKQRVSLARAVYSDTDVYLFDDPLNAVDAHVGRHIFDNIIGPKGMLRDRTRVLVTNKLSVLPEVDYIYVMKDGQISECGTYEQLLKSRGLFSKLLVDYVLENVDGVNISENDRTDLITKELKRIENKLALESSAKKPEEELQRRKSSVKDPKIIDNPKTMSQGPGGYGNLTGQEVSQVGSVGLEVHMNFIKTMGMNFMIAIAIYIMSSAFTISSSVWLSAWSNDSLDPNLKNDTDLRNLRLGVYAALGLSESALVIISTILLNLACINGSKILHNRMLARVLKAPMSWFNSTPSGRIINRFSKDIDTVDVTIRFNVRMLLVIALRSVTSLILVSLGSAYSIILIIPIVLLYFLFQIFYVSTSRQLKRIESTTKSPIYSHFTETIAGTTSIRAFRVSQEFILESNHRVDVNNASVYISVVASRWLAIRLEVLGFIVVLAASLTAVLSRGLISPGIAGLTVSYSLTVTQVLSFLVRNYSDYETNVVSVERLVEYTKVPNEPEDEEEPTDRNWPSRGEIKFENYSTRYRPELDLVLKNINLQVNSEEKLGLVGRTGAGKSSITLSLFRILESTEGAIIIDDVNISHINLKVLRSKLSIIPQDSILFNGTVRQNIDPVEKYTDDEIWRAVELAHLGSFLRSLPDGLDHEVAEGGSNFSVGQKQLFCLARTLLRRSKILILDEATAAVDLETDNLIQQTIRKEFKDSTIVTIAHRLETIQDYDRIVVMEDGAIAEEGSPVRLMKNSKSKFFSLARETGYNKD